MLDEWGECRARVGELHAMPLAAFRSLGWSLSAWMIVSVDPAKVGGFLAKAQAELDHIDHGDTGPSDVLVIALINPWAARLFAALASGSFEEAVDAYQHAIATPGNFMRTAWILDMQVNSAMAEVIVGRPDDALTTIAGLDDCDLPYMDGTDVRALAHLALGDLDTATDHIRQHAKRAATGRFSRESNDAMLLLAALAHYQGDDDAARQFMLDAGSGRTPATNGFARHLAVQLDIADKHAAAMHELLQPGNPHGPLGATRSLRALRTELTRRGWD